MDETIALFLEGCRVARFFETNLPNMANQPENLSRSCDEIIRIFSRAKENIARAQVIIREPHHDWLRNSSREEGMHLLDAEQLMGEWSNVPIDVHGLPAVASLNRVGGTQETAGHTGGRGAQRSLESGREVEPSAEAASSVVGRVSPLQRPRRRRDVGDRRVDRVPAPQMGNTEIPPEDGYTWRKYGQKEILNSKFPRSYFRCTHQKLYHCPAKKQVQRLDDDPNIFEVTYRGDHTCHLSSTAPSVPPPSMEFRGTAAIHPLPTSTTGSISQWLSMDISRPDVIGTQQNLGGLGLVGGGVGPVGSGSSSEAAGPSTTRYGRDVDHLQVADMANAMFNSGSSSNNSMEHIFSSMDDKWDSGDKKN